MHTKSVAAKVKATSIDTAANQGQFTALVAVFGNIDSYGDRIVKGAFTEDLQEWADRGDPIPVVWSHDWGNPFSHIGAVAKAEETDEGLVVTGTVDLDNPTGAQVHRLLQARRITQFSFAFDVLDGGPVKEDGQTVNEITKARIFEVGPCLVGVNRETQLLEAKARQGNVEVKAGRVLSEKNLGLVRAARDALTNLIATASDEDDVADDSKAAEEPATTPTPAPSGAVQTSEPSQVSADEDEGQTPQGEPEVKSDAAPRRALAVALINETI